MCLFVHLDIALGLYQLRYLGVLSSLQKADLHLPPPEMASESVGLQEGA